MLTFEDCVAFSDVEPERLSVADNADTIGVFRLLVAPEAMERDALVASAGPFGQRPSKP